MDRLFSTEMLLADVVQKAAAGTSDGHEIGGHSYDLFFGGDDVDRLWRTLEPALKMAPAMWTTAEIHRQENAEEETHD